MAQVYNENSIRTLDLIFLFVECILYTQGDVYDRYL